jgi:stage III sporulation protein AA
MLSSLLSEEIIKKMNVVNLNDIYEIRMRRHRNITVNVCGQYRECPIICRPEWIEETVLKASGFSIYTVSEQMKAGYISVKGGIRIGICGETVYDGENLKTIKNISSLNIRLPHEIIGCSDAVIKSCFNDNLNSTLIISKPGAGKTTLIRDICRNLSAVYKNINILIIDERGEIGGDAEGRFQFDIGNSDCMLNCTKDFGFSTGIRCMRPDVIVCDELKGNRDTESIYEALCSGVCIIATVHAGSIREITAKRDFKPILASRAFKRFVLLTDKPKIGTIKNIYDDNFKVIL